MSATPTPIAQARRAILESVFASITDSLLVLDSRLCVVDINEDLLRRLGKSREHVLGAAWADLFPHLAEAGWAADLQAALAQKTPQRSRYPLINADDGAATLFDVTIYPVCDPKIGEVTHLVEYAREVSEEVKLQLEVIDAHTDLLAVKDQLEQKTAEVDAANLLLEEKCASLEALNKRLEYIATLDVMTNLPNHRAFQENLMSETNRAQRYARPLSLALFDVDFFKEYNDHFGHPQGDVLLAQLSDLIRQKIRTCDLPARYGGEEFAVLLPDTDKYGAAIVADRLRAAVAAFAFAYRTVTISIGIAEFPGDAATPSDLVACADTAMYHAKSLGRNRISLWRGLPERTDLTTAALVRTGGPACRSARLKK